MASKVYKYGNRELRLTPTGNTWKIELKQKNLQWLTKHDWKNPDAPARARVVESWMDISGRGVSGETEDAALRRAKNQSMDYPASTEIQGKEHMRPGDKLVASRPGTPVRFAVEDRFYFGKGRKAKFAWQPEITNEIRRHELGIRTAEENLRSASKEGKWAVAKSFCNQAKNHYAALADLYSQLARLVTNPRKGI